MAVNATQQGGWVSYFSGPFEGPHNAALWSGTAGSFVNLHPTGVDVSRIAAMSSNLQGGHTITGGTYHAALWQGTAGSYVDLNPAGAGSSHVSGMTEGFQVGTATIEGANHAALWTGSAASFIDLHAALSSDYYHSEAFGTYFDGTNLFIVGSAYYVPTGITHAMMWTTTIPEPATVATLLGLVSLAIVALRRRKATVSDAE